MQTKNIIELINTRIDYLSKKNLLYVVVMGSIEEPKEEKSIIK